MDFINPELYDQILGIEHIIVSTPFSESEAYIN